MILLPYFRTLEDSANPTSDSSPAPSSGKKERTEGTDPACTNNTSRRKHGSGCDYLAILIATPRTSAQPSVFISELRPNLETLFSPRPKVGAGKFGKMTPLKLRAVSE